MNVALKQPGFGQLEFDAFFVMEKNENQTIYNFNTP